MENPQLEWVLGPNAVGEALCAGRREVRVIYLVRGRGGPKVEEILRRAREAGVEVKQTGRRELAHLCGEAHHQGVAAQVGGFPPLSLEDLRPRIAAAGPEALVVVLDCVEDPRNLGAVIRCALAFAAQGVIAPRDRAAGVGPAALKAAAGALEYLPLVEVTNLARSLEALKDQGLWVVGAVAGEGEDLCRADLSGPLALVLGGEDRGLRRLTREKCDRLVSIPLAAEVSSLNVAAAAAIILYEISRRRSLSGQPPGEHRPYPSG